jgi:hypothetical protein
LAHLRESRISQRQAPGPVSRMLIQLGTPCHALVQRRHLAVTSFSAQGGETINETCCGLQRGERLGAQGNPHVEVSTHAPKSVAHPRSAASGPGPELACSRWRRHRRIDPGRLRIRRHASEPFAFHQSPGGLPPPECRGDAGFFRHHEDVGWLDARARSGRADSRQSREPSLPRGLLVRLCRQTVSATTTGLVNPSPSGCQLADNVEALASSARCTGHRAASCAHDLPRGGQGAFASLTKRGARCRDCEQSQRPSSNSPHGGLAASGCQSRQPEGDASVERALQRNVNHFAGEGVSVFSLTAAVCAV